MEEEEARTRVGEGGGDMEPLGLVYAGADPLSADVQLALDRKEASKAVWLAC